MPLRPMDAMSGAPSPVSVCARRAAHPPVKQTKSQVSVRERVVLMLASKRFHQHERLVRAGF